MKITLSAEAAARIVDINKAFMSQAILSPDDNARNILLASNDDGDLMIVGRAPSMGFTIDMDRKDYSIENPDRFVVTTDNLGKALGPFSNQDENITIDITDTHVTFSTRRKKMKVDRQRIDNDFALPSRLDFPDEAETVGLLGSAAEMARAFSLVKGNRYKEDFAADSVFAGVLIDVAANGIAMFAANASSIAQATSENYVKSDSISEKIIDPRLVPALNGSLEQNEPVSLHLSGKELVAQQVVDGTSLTVSLALMNFSVESMRRDRLLDQAAVMAKRADIYVTADGREFIDAMREAGSIDRASLEDVRLKIVGDKLIVQSITNGVYGADITANVKKRDTSPSSSIIEMGSTNLKSMLSKKANSLIRMTSSEKSGAKVPIVLIGDDDGSAEPNISSGWFLIETGVSK